MHRKAEKLTYLCISDNRMSGTVPESIGQLVLLDTLYLGYETNSNMFEGPLPSSMGNLTQLNTLYLNVPTLTGPLPDLSRATLLADCAFKPSRMCTVPHFIPANSTCDFLVLLDCDMIVADCKILAEWLPNMFDSDFCCLEDGVTCEEDHIVILDLSSARTGKHISGTIPSSVGELYKLQQLYLQQNFLEGNLPLSMSNLSSLQIVDISNNFLSGLIPFDTLFEIIGIESNLDLSLPIDLPSWEKRGNRPVLLPISQLRSFRI
jgi:hypothetical protein